MGSYKKKLFIVLLLFLLINFFVCSSVNATTTYQNEERYTINTIEYLKQQQEVLATLFINNLKNSSFYSQNENTIKQAMTNYYCFFTYSRISEGTVTRINCHFYSFDTNFYALSDIYQDTSQAPYYDYNITVPLSGVQLNNNTANVSIYYYYNLPSTFGVGSINSFFLPTFLIYYKNQTVLNFVNGIDPNTTPWTMLHNAIKENTESQDETTQAVNNLRNDFNEEESDSDYSFPTDNPTQDTAEASIDSIFTLFYDKINAWSSAQMQIPIPFTGKHFNIPPNLTENIINGFPAGNVISRLLGLIWYYLLGVYIIKDVQKYIDGLQTGEILTKSDTNIKTEML